jgi:tRNA threonylcarbamoyladenosine biosynthesis protein TsaE
MGSIYRSQSTRQTQDVAQELAKSLRGGEMLALVGDLGAGKTTFTQGLARALGVVRAVNSPTFIIHRSYETMHPKIKKLHHIDLYRIEGEADLEGLGLEEVVHQEDQVVVVEWPEKMGSRLSKERITITFEYISDSTRRIKIDK